MKYFTYNSLKTLLRCIIDCFIFPQTYIGDVLISVNPYKSLSIYNDKIMLKYYNKNYAKETPHMWVTKLIDTNLNNLLVKLSETRF